jgi:hypothetical protein
MAAGWQAFQGRIDDEGSFASQNSNPSKQPSTSVIVYSDTLVE